MFEDLELTWRREAASVVVVASITAEVEVKRELDARNWNQFHPNKRRGKIVWLHSLSCIVIGPNSQEHAMDGPNAGSFLLLLQKYDRSYRRS